MTAADDVEAWDALLEYRWGWNCEWFGWRRMLWLTVAIDFKWKLAYVVVFGLAVSYGKHLVKANWTTTTMAPSP